MTNITIIERIKDEIDRLYGELPLGASVHDKPGHLSRSFQHKSWTFAVGLNLYLPPEECVVGLRIVHERGFGTDVFKLYEGRSTDCKDVEADFKNILAELFDIFKSNAIQSITVKNYGAFERRLTAVMSPNVRLIIDDRPACERLAVK